MTRSKSVGCLQSFLQVFLLIALLFLTSNSNNNHQATALLPSSIRNSFASRTATTKTTFLSSTKDSSTTTTSNSNFNKMASSCSTLSRTIERVVQGTKINPSLTRLIGTVDMDGQGTSHALAEVDPFLLLDQGHVPKPNMPPFGAHPHRGHSVVTILRDGAVKSWDAFRGDHDDASVYHTLHKPASYWVDAGSGVFHDEKSVGHMTLYQLWVMVAEADRQKPPRVQYNQDLPTVDLYDNGDTSKKIGQAVYHVGGPGNTIETPHPITALYIQQQAGSTFHLPIDPHHQGFVVLAKGQATFGGTAAEEVNTVLVLDQNRDDPKDILEIATADSDVEYLVATGQPIGENWFKKLVANGAVIAATKEEAAKIAAQVEQMSANGKRTEAGNGSGSFAPFGK